MKAKVWQCLIIEFCLLLSACSNPNRAPPDLNMVISVSSDGHYAIATNTNKQAILWNLQNHSYKIVFKNANIYSAYFIKNTDDFMYQNDANNQVIIENVNGQIVKSFNPGFPTFGEVMTSDLNSWFAADNFYQLYKIDLKTGTKKQFFYYYCGPNYKDEVPPPQGMPYDCDTLMGSDKLLNLNLTPDDKQLITAGNSEFYIWDVTTTQMLTHIAKNDEQTVAAISPDGTYLVTGDLDSMGYYYNLKNNDGYNFFITSPENELTKPYFESLNQNSINAVFSLKFIDSNRIIAILNGVPNLFNFVGLYDIDNMSFSDQYWTKKYQVPIKYLPLIPNAATDTNYQKDWPLTTDEFSRDEAIDTSPSAHILVMSMAEKNGIIVYHYDPASQTLTREWAGEVKSWWKF